MVGRTDPPPSRAAWLADSELNGGHTVQQVIAYLDWCDDWAAQQATDRAVPSFIISPEISWWRGLFRRGGGRRA